MFLKRVYGENVSNYDKISYSFKSGLTIIEGDNLSGKSSIIDLVEFATFGSCTKSKKIEYFKKRGSSGSLVAEVEYEKNGESWVISRIYSKSEKTASLTINGVEKANGIDNVNKYLQDNFVNEALLLNSNLCRQKGSTSLLETKDTERFNITKKIFSLDEYRIKSEVVKADIDKNNIELVSKKQRIVLYKKDIEEKETFISSFDINKVNSDISSFKTKIISLVTSKEQLMEKKFSLSSKLQESEKVNKEAQAKEKEYNDICKEYSEQEKSLPSFIKKIKELDSSIDNINIKKVNLTNEINTLQEEITKLVPLRIKKFDDSELLNCITNIKELEYKQKEIAKKIEFVNKKICPTCGQDIKNLDISALEKEYQNIESDIISKKELKIKLMKDKEEYELKEKQNNEIKENKNKMVNNIDSKKESLINNDSLIESYEDNKKNLIKNKEEIEKSLTILKDKKCNFVVPVLVDTSALEVEIKENNEKVSSITIEIDSNNIKVKDLETLLNNYENCVKSLETLKNSIEKEELEIIKLNELINDLTEVRLIFEKKLPLYVVLHKLSFISNKSNEFLHNIFNKYDISFEQNKEALSVVFTDTVTNMPSDYSNLSGFESALGGIAVRMGFSLYNSIFNSDPVNWIILDEVDASFTSKNSELLYSSIFQLKNMFKQIIMVTHKTDVKDSLNPDDVIVVKNTGTNSYIEIINE